MKQCSKCGAEKSLSEFYRVANSDRLRSACKACVNGANLARQAANPEKYNARTKAWREKNPGRTTANIRAWQIRNPERHKANIYWTGYRIDFAAVWDSQKGLCACCGKQMLREGKESTSVVADHDRRCCPDQKSCGRCFRGLIHRNCNLVLGYAQDAPVVLRSAVEFLVRWKDRPSRPELEASPLPPLAPVEGPPSEKGPSRAWQLRNPERFKAQMFKSRYRVDFASLWDSQSGLCACCKKPLTSGGKEPGSSTVDHDRRCCPGKKSCGRCVRGLIHRNCNLVLGYAKDNIEVLRSAANYLEQWGRRFSVDSLSVVNSTMQGS